MKRLIIAALVGSAALLASTTANALTFAYTGHIDSYTVQTSGWYEIDAWGAQGGSYVLTNSGGLGAMVGGRIYLDAGEALAIVVGGQGRGDINGNTGSGGGGGSFVFVASDLDLLLAAGGGGGSGWLGRAGGPGLAGRNGGGVGGGTDGLGGAAAGQVQYGIAGGGTGWFGPGESGTTGVRGAGGTSAPSFAGGATQGCTNVQIPECESGFSGGFGGGGGAAYNYGGGGGGYSGGAAGPGGFGGGSYIADGFYDFVGQSGVRTGSGLVTIDLVPVPEPTAWAMMLLGFFGLGSLLRRRRLGAGSPGPLCSPHP